MLLTPTTATMSPASLVSPPPAPRQHITTHQHLHRLRKPRHPHLPWQRPIQQRTLPNLRPPRLNLHPRRHPRLVSHRLHHRHHLQHPPRHQPATGRGLPQGGGCGRHRAGHDDHPASCRAIPFPVSCLLIIQGSITTAVVPFPIQLRSNRSRPSPKLQVSAVGQSPSVNGDRVVC